jgi:KaiC/GvpD/RAD55 family RecA-like ATPase
MPASRQSTGIPALDDLLGGGLVPGTLTVVAGATGIGKTQLGLQIANAGAAQEGRRGVIFDCTARGDSQSHADYARRMFDWQMAEFDASAAVNFHEDFETSRLWADYLHVFDYRGRRVTRRDLEWEDWREWQAELNSRLRAAIAFLYGHFLRGGRRVVIDGFEPVDRPGESIQFNLLEYVYQQVVRKDPEWVARDLLREHFREFSELAAQHIYPTSEIGCVLMYTSREIMLDELISRPLDEGDALSNANTIIYLGKIRDGNRIGRALYVAKHRGSACEERIVEYTIDDAGLKLQS